MSVSAAGTQPWMQRPEKSASLYLAVNNSKADSDIFPALVLLLMQSNFCDLDCKMSEPDVPLLTRANAAN